MVRARDADGRESVLAEDEELTASHTSSSSKEIREELASFFHAFQTPSTSSAMPHTVDRLKEFFSSNTAEALSRLRRSFRPDDSSLCRAYSFPLLTQDPFSKLFPPPFKPSSPFLGGKEVWASSCSNLGRRQTVVPKFATMFPLPLQMRQSSLTSSSSSLAPIEVSS